LKRIQTRSHLALNEFLNDADAQDVVVLNFQNAIQGCIDLADHIIADQEWGTPGSFSEAIDTLAEHDMIPQTDAENYKSMIRFRNLIVHAYAKIDYRKVYEVMQTGPQDIECYLDYVATFCKI
jgi:uncharacterized protein YutE (UPF0331/DUF86 family)